MSVGNQRYKDYLDPGQTVEQTLTNLSILNKYMNNQGNIE